MPTRCTGKIVGKYFIINQYEVLYIRVHLLEPISRHVYFPRTACRRHIFFIHELCHMKFLQICKGIRARINNWTKVVDTHLIVTLSEILAASSRVATSFDRDLAFGAVDVNDNLAYTSLVSPLSPLPPPIASPPSSAAAGEPI